VLPPIVHFIDNFLESLLVKLWLGELQSLADQGLWHLNLLHDLIDNHGLLHVDFLLSLGRLGHFFTLLG
jgi:hypothetical protein